MKEGTAVSLLLISATSRIITELTELSEYEAKRKSLIETNSNLLGVVLNEKEKSLDKILSNLKKKYKDTCNGQVPYNIPVLTDKNISESELYSFCKKLPKGSDLHVHDLAQLPIRELIKLLITRDEFYINTDHNKYNLIRVLPGEDIPNGYMLFRDAMNTKEFSPEELIQNWTVLGAEKNGIGIWDWFEELFVKHAVLSNYNEFAKVFYDYTFRYYISVGIYHTEIHLLLTDDLEDTAEYIKTVRQAYYDVKKDFPFFSARIIGAGLKDDNNLLQSTKKCFLNTLYAQENIKDESDPDHISNFVIGFDLINEEDTNLPLHDFAPLLLKASEKYPEMKLFIHGGESLDARNENLIDAYLLGVSRVGHGLNLYRFPDLLEKYSKSEICLEVCVISNQTLGYTKDIRNHPAVEYLRRGVAVALCSDDPTYQENETLVDDFFAAIVCWDLNVADIKQLCINSIVYSGLGEYGKTKLLKTFKQKWDSFVNNMLN